jgi:hypothetical protein
MHHRTFHLALHVTRPARGSDFRHFMRELSRLAGVVGVSSTGRFSRLLMIAYDPQAIRPEAFVERARRAWGVTQIVRMRPDA